MRQRLIVMNTFELEAGASWATGSGGSLYPSITIDMEIMTDQKTAFLF